MVYLAADEQEGGVDVVGEEGGVLARAGWGGWLEWGGEGEGVGVDLEAEFEGQGEEGGWGGVWRGGMGWWEFSRVMHCL